MSKIFLPKTSFSMRGNLPQKEPEILQTWTGLYEKLREKSKKKQNFVLHFGPPYANNHIHAGTAFSHVLKDIVNKTFQMSGFNAPLIPGWDCHGLPIEWKVEEDFRAQGKKKEDIPVIEFRDTCRKFAAHWMNIQREEFKRLGIIADWDHPYSTMAFETEATIVEQLNHFLMNGTLYRGTRIVFWSVAEETALAENEAEYKNVTSPSIYVKFAVKSHPKLYCVIWTTTPWTIPANRAIAYNPKLEYCIVETSGDSYVIAKACAKRFVEACNITNYRVLPLESPFETLVCQHPFAAQGYNFEVKLYPGEHVTTEAGTGLVHTAPAYGEDDFAMAQQFNLPIDDILTKDGHYLASVPVFAGEHIYTVAPKVIAQLKENDRLLSEGKIEHSYPHSWRSKKPLIYRATSQWFIEIDKSGIRTKAMKAINKVNWFPESGENRIRGMMETRPPWCVSRQRAWGTPIAVFLHKKTQQPLRDQEVQDRIVSLFKEYGGDAWYVMPNEIFLGNKYNPDEYEKVMDVLDVWFDSGCTQAFVLRPRNLWPADLVLEGSDQHRGWFQSLLLAGVGVYGSAPYKAVLTHGFVLDEKGYKMSKSLGNVVTPQEIIDQYGADVLRQWIIMADYTEDVRFGPAIMKVQQEIYRKFRNTLRYLLGALHEFTEEQATYQDLPDLEKYMLHKLAELDQLHKECLKVYDLKRFYHALYLFCNNELSSLYFDVRKDTLYCDAVTNPKRIGCRTVMHHIVHALVRWLAPVLSFTAEEAWKALGGETSIHEETFMSMPETWTNLELAQQWEKLLAARSVITAALEKIRHEKVIGSSLEAHVDLYGFSCDPELMSELTITSSLSVKFNQSIPEGAYVVEGIGAVAVKAEGKKCDRCWKLVSELTDDGLCHRCKSVV